MTQKNSRAGTSMPGQNRRRRPTLPSSPNRLRLASIRGDMTAPAQIPPTAGRRSDDHAAQVLFRTSEQARAVIKEAARVDHLTVRDYLLTLVARDLQARRASEAARVLLGNVTGADPDRYNPDRTAPSQNGTRAASDETALDAKAGRDVPASAG